VAVRALVGFEHEQPGARRIEAQVGVRVVAARMQATMQPERRAEARDQAARLLTLVEGLPAVQREAFLLHEEGGLSLEQIAEVTGTGRETVKSRLRYALDKLREGMRDYL